MTNSHSGISREPDSPVKSNVSQNTAISAKKSYVRTSYQNSDPVPLELYPGIGSDLLRILFKVFSGSAIGSEILAALILIFNPQYKTYSNIIFYICMIIVLGCAFALIFEYEEIIAGVNCVLRFLSHEIWLSAYLCVNLIVADWGMTAPIDKGSTSMLIIAAIFILAMVTVRVLAIWF